MVQTLFQELGHHAMGLSGGSSLREPLLSRKGPGYAHQGACRVRRKGAQNWVQSTASLVSLVPASCLMTEEQKSQELWPGRAT